MKSFLTLLKEAETEKTKEPDITENPSFKKWFGNSKIVDAHGKPLVVYHGTNNEFTVFKNQDTAYGFFFTADEEAAKYYAHTSKKAMAVYLKMEKPAELDDYAIFNELAEEAVFDDTIRPTHEAYKHVTDQISLWAKKNDTIAGILNDYHFYDKFDEPKYSDLEDFLDEIETDFHEQTEKIRAYLDKKENKFKYEVEEARRVFENELQNWYMNYQDDFVKAAEHLGYDGVITSDAKGGGGVDTSYIVFKPTQVKSATDNDGNFKRNDPDITH